MKHASINSGWHKVFVFSIHLEMELVYFHLFSFPQSLRGRQNTTSFPHSMEKEMCVSTDREALKL